ncbi:hypothetical protein F4778DRAFT_221926 [Xylariomycetidae sp. FL2044]|nr:hypothetical protein F4778DRAFT_221926 [Xylariomycetidae sp. FL2044]
MVMMMINVARRPLPPLQINHAPDICILCLSLFLFFLACRHGKTTSHPINHLYQGRKGVKKVRETGHIQHIYRLAPQLCPILSRSHHILSPWSNVLSKNRRSLQEILKNISPTPHHLPPGGGDGQETHGQIVESVLFAVCLIRSHATLLYARKRCKSCPSCFEMYGCMQMDKQSKK